jgi:hypothetical protein
VLLNRLAEAGPTHEGLTSHPHLKEHAGNEEGRPLMNKAPNFCLSLLMCAAWLPGQPAYQGSNASKTANDTPGPAILEGCLQKSEGEYTVVDKNGILHHLTDTGKLKSYIGHEVELTGTPSTRTIDTTMAGGASSAIEKPIFRVKAMKDLAATCQTR